MKNFGSNAPKKPTKTPMPKVETPKPSDRPRHYYERVFVILQDGTTRQYDNADVCLFDNLLTITTEGSGKAYYNFNNIVGFNCCD